MGVLDLMEGSAGARVVGSRTPRRASAAARGLSDEESVLSYEEPVLSDEERMTSAFRTQRMRSSGKHQSLKAADVVGVQDDR